MDTLCLFALAGSRDLGRRIAARLGIEPACHEERRFEDGEHKLRPLQSVRGRPVVVLSSLHSDPGLNVNDKIMRLALFCGALHDASAREITLLLPYLAYARKDRRTKPRDPVSLRYLAAMLEAVGADRVATLEVHNPAAFQNAFRIVTEHLPAAALLVPHVAEPLRQAARIVVVSPDTGGYKRAQDFRQRLERNLGREIDSAFVEKLRSGGELQHGRLVGDVKGATVLIVDDLIVTGRTLIHAARTCKQAGAVQVTAVAAHGLFDASANAILADAALDRIVVSDSVPLWRLENPAVAARLETVDSSPFLAEVVRRIHAGESLNDWLGG
ncbi:ribose-phosphate pyrophosphokinase [Methylomarinovum caldicuralii]|uniref:ribose-phosphate diphosphokinase n=1 Tax=Methylomarinovum caldicuralii TaxID=438856 RepID=A0AAU9CVI4_9GAMM|nr:ribose-phosphate pyrophosphokinase [Methylomarinovum caldicuralii]BCX81937.1 ribose-phosphate pyrophosphokinase [Methylomarinovum caldicuralii]